MLVKALVAVSIFVSISGIGVYTLMFSSARLGTNHSTNTNAGAKDTNQVNRAPDESRSEVADAPNTPRQTPPSIVTGSAKSTKIAQTSPRTTPVVGTAPSATCTAAQATSAYDTQVLADAPKNFWTVGQDTSGACDLTATKRHGVNINAPTVTAMPNGDKALAYNGVNQYTEFADNDAYSASTTGIITIEAWLRPDTLQAVDEEGGGYVYWGGKGQPNQHEYAFRMYSQVNSENRPNRISGYAFNAAGGLGTGSYFQDVVKTNEWIHYVLVINTQSVDSVYPTGYTKIYKNGAQRDKDSLSDYSVVPFNGAAPLRFGTRDFQSYFQGAVGKIAVYDRELTAQQVWQHYQNMVPATTGTARLVGNVASASTKVSGTALSLPVTRPIAAGNTLVIRTATGYSTSAPTVTDSRGNTYTRDRTAPAFGNTFRASIYSSRLTSSLLAGDLISVTTSTALTPRAAIADEFTGLIAPLTVDVQNGSTANSTTPGSSISITTLQADDLVLGFTAVNGPNSDNYIEDTLGWSALSRIGTSGGTDLSNITVNGGFRSTGATGNFTYRPVLEFSRPWTEFLVAYRAQ